MRFSVGQLAALLGVSQSTIRRYEKYDANIGQRDMQNQYRFYSIADALKLATYISINSQFYKPVEVHNTDREKSISQFIFETKNKIQAIDSRITELNAIKYCWEQQLRLTHLLDKLIQEDIPFEYIDYPAMIIDPLIKSIDLQKDSLYFHMFREKNTVVNLCRMCTVWNSAHNASPGSTYFQAISFFQDHISPEILERFPYCYVVPSQRYIAIASQYGGILDTDLPQSRLDMQLDHISNRFKALKTDENNPTRFPAYIMSVQIKKTTNPSLILIPYVTQ